MATVNEPRSIESKSSRQAAQGTGLRRWRWTAKQYHKLANLGFFGDRKVELINGEIFPLTTNPHMTRLSA